VIRIRAPDPKATTVLKLMNHGGSPQALGLVVTLLLAPAAALAERAPEKIDGATRVSAEDVIELANRLDDLIIVDSRIGGDRKQGYLEGSVSIPDGETNCAAIAKRVPSRDTPVVFYCNGVRCNRSGRAVTAAIACGYRNIYWFRGGFEEWVAKGYPYLRE